MVNLLKILYKNFIRPGKCITSYFLKIAGRKRPALVDPSHKVRQGGKGSV